MDLVVVTGAFKGLGFAICKHLLKNGYSVVGIGRTLTSEYQELQEQYQDYLFHEVFDFNNIEDIKALSKKITSKYGVIYGLVNNAALGHDGVLATMHESQIEELIRVNVQAPIVLTKYISRSMLIRQRGRIINISSVIATTGYNGLSVYGATKSALSGFTRSLARELGRANITVNTVAPGFMDTSMTSSLKGEKLDSIRRRSPLNRMATVDDVANSVGFLLTPAADNITGSTITIDAGSTA
ncbi:SDR family oxidoreductase [Sansalvadorimonas sp. 2012CJ34-2]|uniref:SDR family oxidoreductase n=1 Tax=Parendozoicomonas callyspongiae TaxID=2942213 RepID=A0ABT0PKG5_9GAMM|nr:SDR family oxidoreductase [Sansalvadorimonas sp. 2012CJ34-2]MCL6271887.1 SDR family oxidoreductase [Sansalvadorimonas sp. 2012CJ34-2]